jgi:phosphomannomutase
MNWKKLQNGSDIRGIAVEGVEGENVNLTADAAKTLAKAFAKWLKAKNNDDDTITVAVGRDSRVSGPALQKATIEGLTESGCNVQDCGLASTPAMFMVTIDDNKPATAGIMITASHLPFNRNGLKFFTKEGGLEKSDIAELVAIAEKGDFNVATEKGAIEQRDYMTEYSADLVDYIRKGADSKKDYEHPLSGMRIIVDAGNGNGGFFAEKVLKPLGADIEGSQFLEPDGMFPNHIPNPENKEAMQSICDAVVNNKAHLGIIFDTDVDRSAIVDSRGDSINRNTLIALISSVILREHPGSTIVTDSVTSDGLAEFITSLGGKHHRFKRGYKNVINESKRLNASGEESWLAIETSGHAALRENHFLDDGAYLVAKLLIEAAKLNEQGKELASLIETLKQPRESKEIRFTINCEDFASYGQQVLDDLKDTVAQMDDWALVEPNFEGVRVSCANPEEDGWFLLRLSLHDPVLPLNIESNVEDGIVSIESRIMRFISRYDKLKR